MKDTITLTKVNLYGETVTRKITIGDLVIRKDIGGFYTFQGLTSSGLAVIKQGNISCGTPVDNLRF